MYQGPSSIALSEIRPTGGWARCTATYASTTGRERSRSRRIIEEPAEGDAGSRNLLSPAPRSLTQTSLTSVRTGSSSCHASEQQLHRPGRDRLSLRDRWVAKLVLLS